MPTGTEIEKLDTGQFWRYVAVHLKKHGYDTVLVGGAVVAIYSDDAYTSGDLDFIVTNKFTLDIEPIMAEIGFSRLPERRYFAHKESKKFLVEFPPGPVEIADNTDIRPKSEKVGQTVIKILSPTDCIIDRLMSYIHFKGHREDIENAVLVARRQKFSKAAVKAACLKYHRPDVYDEFIALL
jgi:hypothetical protein